MNEYKSIPSGEPIMPWKLELEFNDAMCCKLYSQLSFTVKFNEPRAQEENDDPTAPPTSPVKGFKYAPLLESRKLQAYESTKDVIDNLFPLYEDSDDQALNSEGSNFLGGLDNANRTKKKSKVSRDSSMNHLPKKTETYIWRSEKSVKPVSRKSCKEGDLRNKPKEFLRNSTVYRNRNDCPELQTSLCILYKPSKEMSKYTLKEIDKARSITKKTISCDEEEGILSKLREHALLANRSSNNSPLASSSLSQTKQTNYTRDSFEKHTFLRRENIFKNNNRPVPFFNPKQVFNFTTKLRNTPHLYESRMAIVS